MSAYSDDQLRAILELLHDRSDPEVQAMLQEQLAELDVEVLQKLRIQAARASDQALMDIETAIHTKLWDHLAEELETICNPGHGTLMEMLLLLARFGHINCAPELVRTAFEELAKRCQATFAPDDSALTKAEKMAAVLGDQMGFTGNEDDYYSPENSFIDSVLRTRLGIPISLSAVYLVVGELLDVPLRGVALPGHFLVGLFVWNQKAHYFDPFNKGRRLSKVDCAELVSGLGHRFDEHLLQPVTTRYMLQRMLNNLYVAYDRQGDLRHRDGVVRLVRAVA